MTTTWSINTLERETANGYVYTVHYDVNATDGTYASRAYGSVNLEKPETLVPYADLTSEQVIGWVKAKLTAENADAIENIEAALATQISEQRAPTKAQGIPWTVAAPEVVEAEAAPEVVEAEADSEVVEAA